MKVLITGMTSPQASSKFAERNACFAGLLRDVLVAGKNDVVMQPPSIEMTPDELDAYDMVLVGLAPITSVAANYAYGALHVIDTLHGSKKLRYFIDAPEPMKIVSGANAVADSPDSLFKPFYSARPEYGKARGDGFAEKILRGVSRLSGYTWAKTIYPVLPWGNHGLVVNSMPLVASPQLHSINVDAMIFARADAQQDLYSTSEGASRFWVANEMKNQWTISVSSTMKTPVLPVREHKGWTDVDAVQRMREAVGVLVAPSKVTGSWWSPRVAQALSVGVPVVTDWRESAIIGEPWLDLAVKVDEMPPQKRKALAAAQLHSYKSIIASGSELDKHVIDVLLPSSK